MSANSPIITAGELGPTDALGGPVESRAICGQCVVGSHASSPVDSRAVSSLGLDPLGAALLQEGASLGQRPVSQLCVGDCCGERLRRGKLPTQHRHVLEAVAAVDQLGVGSRERALGRFQFHRRCSALTFERGAAGADPDMLGLRLRVTTAQRAGPEPAVERHHRDVVVGGQILWIGGDRVQDSGHMPVRSDGMEVLAQRL